MQDRQYYDYGDIYQTIDACDELETQLARLKRQHFLTEREWSESKQAIDTVRDRLQSHVNPWVRH